MNCRGFERKAADWIGGRLPDTQAQQMADHITGCVACARQAQAEETLRRSWRELTPSPFPDCWPRLATSLAARKPTLHRPAILGVWPTWALGGAVFAALVAVSGLHLRPMGGLATPGPARPAISGAGFSVTAPPPATAHWHALADVSQEDPGVDDPAGTNMEAIWNQINTENLTSEGVSQTTAAGGDGG